MRIAKPLVLALAAALPTAAEAEVPAWMSGDWSTNARLTAPDGASIRIRCTLDAEAESADTWAGVLGCATVQGRFEGRWRVAIAGSNANGVVAFSGTENAQVPVSGAASANSLALSSDDGQGVTFSPAADGALSVAMQAMGPQRLTGTLTFEVR
jgi:hypothetical protein